MKVRKAVIPAAGWGGRFAPITKTQPKEMLPLLNRPLIQYAVEEALAAGLSEVIIINSSGKQVIAEYFEPAPAFAAFLQRMGAHKLVQEVRSVEALAVNIRYVTQPEPRGFGHALLSVEGLVGDEPFAVILPDDVVDGREPVLSQMLPVFERYEASVIAVDAIDTRDVNKYGVIRPERLSERVYRVQEMVEKPAPEFAPSRLGIVGRYILTPQIFEAIRRTNADSSRELQLIDALSLLLGRQAIYAVEFEGERYDCGYPFGWTLAQVAFGLKHPEFGDKLREQLRRMV
jgi:UTP--glucose-1-phosphate uridylyltransferase